MKSAFFSDKTRPIYWPVLSYVQKEANILVFYETILYEIPDFIYLCVVKMSSFSYSIDS